MQITELIEKAVQCLEALGLDPETIYDYRFLLIKQPAHDGWLLLIMLSPSPYHAPDSRSAKRQIAE